MGRARAGTAAALGAAGMLSAGLALPGCDAAGDLVPIGRVATEVEAGAGVRWLNVKNAAGSIRLAPSASDRISVAAHVSVRESLRERFPTADLARDLEVKVDGEIASVNSRHYEGRGSDWKLDLVIEAPARLHWTVMQAVGDARIEAAGNAVVASMAAGSIELTGSAANIELVAATGSVRADVERLAGGTINVTSGQVRLSVRESGPSEALAVTTATGDVSIELPRSASATVDLQASVGAVELRNAPGVKMEQGLVGRRAAGMVGRGGPQLTAVAGVGRVTFALRE
jgi:hypothetical protein